jgi:hypothetical protein
LGRFGRRHSGNALRWDASSYPIPSRRKDGAFRDCSGLTTVTLGDGLEEIGEKAFMDCRFLEETTELNTIKRIKDWAFFNCFSLTAVTFGEGTEEIGRFAFSSCISLH